MAQQTALMFASGGGLGPYDLGVLKRLYEIEPDFLPTMVTGVSMGAIQAAVVAGGRGHPVQTLEAMWGRLARFSAPFLTNRTEQFLSLLANPNFYRLRLDYARMPFWTGFYSSAPLRRLLLETLDFDRLNDGPVRLIIPVVDIENSEIICFDNQGPDKTRITVDHLLANASLPPIFPMVEVAGRYYWDGGFFDHTPLSVLIHRLSPDPAVQKRLIVMSLLKRRDPLPSNMIEVNLRLIAMMMADKIPVSVDLTRNANRWADFYSLLDAQLPESSPVRQLQAFQNLGRYKHIHRIYHVCNEDPRLTKGDLSGHLFHQRVMAGYEDACGVFTL